MDVICKEQDERYEICLGVLGGVIQWQVETPVKFMEKESFFPSRRLLTKLYMNISTAHARSYGLIISLYEENIPGVMKIIWHN